MVAGTRYQDDWVLDLYRAAQAAIGQELKIECEPPGELTPELTIILRKLDEPRHESKDGRVSQPGRRNAYLKPWQRGGPTPNPHGRGKGTPNKFSQKLVADFARHWRDHGYSAIERMYEENPGLYLKIATSLVPRELLLEVSRPMEQLSDAELQRAAVEEQEASQKLIAHIRLRGGEELIEQARRELTGDDEEDDEERE